MYWLSRNINTVVEQNSLIIPISVHNDCNWHKYHKEILNKIFIYNKTYGKNIFF